MSEEGFLAIGMMSGTSIDGIDTALIRTDGHGQVEPLAFASYPYSEGFRSKLRRCFGNRSGGLDRDVAVVERELTELHADAVKSFLDENLLTADAIDLIGFHGQTIWHRPEERQTIQIGDGSLLARLTGIPVINDFRTADVLDGGQGAPLVPLYHYALSAELPKPVAILNIGGVSNITWIGEGEEDIIAFDMGPGNALLDDWMLKHTGKPYDECGSFAALGKANEDVVARFLRHPYFSVRPPKSLDRDTFGGFVPDGLSSEDGAATLTLITAWAVFSGISTFLGGARKPQIIYVTGGGRHNKTMVGWIEQLTKIPVGMVDDLGWSGDGLEAEAFAYLAVRSRLGLPLSLPGTTGVSRPMPGGRLHQVG